MSTLTVGTGLEYTTIQSAVAASTAGDTIDVAAGTYTNDFVTITHDLTLTAVGGTVNLVATQNPPNGKAIIDEGGTGVNVSITGLNISGAVVADGNGAGIRYEGGTLTLDNDNIHGNQEGILAASDPAGTITINNSVFADNGTGTGYTHNIYVGDIASLTVENSTITGAISGHDIKSRAEATTITGNTITDGTTGTASYEIDLPNGGNALIEGNVIQKGANAQNPIAISFGEEGNVYAGSSLTVTGNTILNDDPASSSTAVVNDTSATASITANTLYGWHAASSGPAALSGNVTLATEPLLASLTPGTITTGTTDTGGTTGTTTPPVVSTPPVVTTPTSVPPSFVLPAFDYNQVPATPTTVNGVDISQLLASAYATLPSVLAGTATNSNASASAVKAAATVKSSDGSAVTKAGISQISSHFAHLGHSHT